MSKSVSKIMKSVVNVASFGVLGNDNAKIGVDKSAYEKTPVDREKLPNEAETSEAAAAAEARRRRLAARAGRASMRTDLAGPRSGAGISIRGM